MPKATAAQKQIRSIRKSITVIERSLRRLSRFVREAPKPSAAGGRRRTLTLSPARRAALKLHGRYMGSIRLLKPRQKARVKDVRNKRGYHAAIALARRLSNS